MDFDREMKLENAGIDAFEFSLMDEDERREALEDAYLDPDDYDLIEYDTSFNAWSNLQNAGLSLSELEYMDEDEKRETLRDAGLDPDDYDVYPSYTPSYTHYSAPNPVNTDKYIPPVKETPDEQKKIRRVYDRVKKEKTQNLFMVYVSLFLILLAGVLSFFLWRNNTHGDYDTILIVMGIAGAVFLIILFRALSTERKLARKISAAERRYTWLSDSPGPGLKGYDRLSGSNDSLTKVIIAVFVILIAIAVLTAGIKEDNRRKEEAEALQRAEEMYQLGLEQFSDGKYSAASKSFGIAKEKNIGESQAYWYYSVGMDYAASNSYYSARDRIKSGSNCATTSETKQVGKKLLAQIEKDEQKYNEQLKKQREEEERQYLQSLAKSLPYVGMSEQYINDTALGKPSSTVRHNREMINGQSLVANLYDYTRNGYVIFTARCINGEVYQVFDHRSDPYKQSSGSSSSSSSKKSSSSTKKSDLFHASDYAHPDDFYYDNYDDFWDYEDAEDYWEAHH